MLRILAAVVAVLALLVLASASLALLERPKAPELIRTQSWWSLRPRT